MQLQRSRLRRLLLRPLQRIFGSMWSKKEREREKKAFAAAAQADTRRLRPPTVRRFSYVLASVKAWGGAGWVQGWG